MLALILASLLLTDGWTFTRTDAPENALPQTATTGWQEVTVPHDWAIYGPFGAANDRQTMAIEQDGMAEAMEHAGRTGGLPFVGTGWYRRNLPEIPAGMTAELEFDGAMSHARVYVNGHEAAYWPYGYNSFTVDITPYLRPDTTNILAVRLENEPESSRWYPGAGLYRNVHLNVRHPLHVSTWGTRAVSTLLPSGQARIDFTVEPEVPDSLKGRDIRIITILRDAAGSQAASASTPLPRYDEPLQQVLYVSNPALWSPETPNLYYATTTVSLDGQPVDEYVTRLGIRTIELKPDSGFYLNGKRTKFRGVCNHHDLGPLGAAINESALRHRLQMLKDMGANAIRSSHNMPSPELVKLCDEMGLMLMAESFDEWKESKMANGYNKVFDQWADRDLTNLIRHYRNSPAIVMWSIGNEVPEQRRGDGMGAKRALMLQNICHREDPTRPVTLGIDAPDQAVSNNMAAVLDIPGFNYRPHRYQNNYNRLPQRFLLGAETASTISSRGVYKFPLERKWMPKYPDHQASSYDVESCSWSQLPEDDFIQHDLLPWAMGEFVWTGFDYLGEPSPYYSDWPSHSSLFGIIDLASLPKDRYWLYRSHWNPTAETLHILPHWTWPGREGEVTPVMVYTNHPSAELFINGKSQGRRTKDLSIDIESSGDDASVRAFKRQERYRLMWLDAVYEPGELRVVAYDAEGRPAAEKTVRTAGKPYALRLTPHRSELAANGQDIAYVTVEVVDKQGNVCPTATNMVTFKAKGAGRFKAATNGDPTSLDSFQGGKMPAFSGALTALIESATAPGNLTLTATAPGLRSATITLPVKPCNQK